MKYNATHKREVIGGQVHETMAEKKKRKMTDMEVNLEQIDSSLSKMRKDMERENVESEYLVPEIKNWIETDSVKAVKERVKSWISLKYPVHIIGTDRLRQNYSCSASGKRVRKAGCLDKWR